MGDDALGDLFDRLDAAAEDLREHGVIVRGMQGDGRRLEVEVIAPDLETARRVMADRYGEAVVVDYLGPDETATARTPWARYELEAPDRLRVFFVLTAAARWLDRVEVAETDQTVTITVFEGFEVGGAEKMPGVPERSEVVALQRALGDRQVRDGSCHRDAPSGTLPP